MNIPKKKFIFVSVFIIFFNLLLSAWWMLHGDITFHTDIARDFLALDEIVFNKNITLIGPRSGGVSGLFHGPLWFYLNAPAFYIGGGNPVVVGWFWVLLFIASLVILFYVTKKLFDSKAAWIAMILFSVFGILSVKALFNPFGAVILSPLFIFFFYRYIQTNKFIYILLSFFTVGIMIQFQIAFGGPILVLTFLYLIYILRKTKLWHHISAVLILVVPLSTYIVFELRNNFLQLRSIALHISQNDEPKNWAIILENRLRGFFIDGTALFPDSYRHFAVLTYLIILIGLYLNRKSKNKNIQVYWLVLFFYVGYWILTLPFSNLVIHYYYWPFLPLFIMCIASMYSVIKKSLFIVVFVLVFGVNFLVGVQSVIESSKVIGKDGSSWLFLDTTIAKVFKDNAEFGYYIYTPDLFAYTPRYAFIYHQRKNPQVKSYSFQKKPITFLYMSPDFDNNTKYHSATWWRANQVRIQSKPAGRIVFPNNQILEKYQLTPQQIGVPSDPNLVSDLFFL